MKKSRDGLIRCDCGKLLAHEKDGKIYVWCKQCKKEVEVVVVKTKTEEPLSR